MKKILLSAFIVGAFLTSCKTEETTVKETVFKGPTENFQHGKAWTWVEVDNDDKPVRLGIAINDSAITSLDRTAPTSSGHHHENSISLTLPAKASATPFLHIGLDWNPFGHEPVPVYGKPHFDFHFYMMSKADRMAIPPYEVDKSKFDKFPATSYFPATYINPGGGVPQMGCHWIDTTSPELGGQPFTQTFIYGSYNGNVTFYEPMITEAFIIANPTFERTIPQPAKFQKTGYYPTKMRISKTGTVTNIILEGFVYRTAS
jgi:hypothetical protein